jgi:hypothetical protein
MHQPQHTNQQSMPEAILYCGRQDQNSMAGNTNSSLLSAINFENPNPPHMGLTQHNMQFTDNAHNSLQMRAVALEWIVEVAWEK